MEFRFRAGDEQSAPFLSALPDGYFAAHSHSLRAGFYSETGRGELPAGLAPLVSAREALERELQKTRIREELIAREIEQRRILEDEVRREIEIERQMALRQVHSGRFTSCLHAFGPEGTRVAERLGVGGVSSITDSKVEERLLNPIQSKNVVPMKLSLPQLKQETSPSTEVKPPPPKTKLPGTKRKAGVDFGEFCCALCHVSTTSKRGLDEHLQGRRHKAKESTLSGKKQLAKNNKASTLPTKEVEQPSPPKDVPANGLVKDEAKGLKKQWRSVKKHFWCEFCKVKCNSEVIMSAHLNGKKHKAQVELAGKNDNKSTISTFSSVEDSKDATKDTMNLKEDNGDGTENRDGTDKGEMNGADRSVKEAPGAAVQSDELGKEKAAADSSNVAD